MHSGYTYSITPKADERLDVSIYEEISGENSHIIHIMVTSPFQEGVNWGSEAVPIVNLRFIPQTAGSIKAYLSDESGVSYNNQESIRYDNYTPFSRPYLMAVVDLNARPTLTPRATSSPWPTATPTFSPAPTPNYEEEYQNLKLQVDNLQNKVEIQEQRLTFLEAVIMRIKRFFANIFSFGL